MKREPTWWFDLNTRVEGLPALSSRLSMNRIVNIAAYKFAPITEPGSKRGRLLSLCRSAQLKGTILLSPEGINLFVAGSAEGIDQLLAELRAWPGLAELEPKFSETDRQPFNRMLVRLKKEIIAFGVEGIAPGERTSPKLQPRTLKRWLDEGRPLTLLDTRNNYEVKLGTFRNAVAIGIDHFRNFPDAVRKLPAELKEQPIVMFCTGGIRCEKAGPFMEREGFKNIFQLDGGILKYFEECGGAHYNGECFVFDQRVGVDPGLRETESTQCFVCLAPLGRAEQADSRYVPGVSCPSCYKTPAEKMAATITMRHENIRRVVSPLPGSRPYDNFRPLTVPSDCNDATLLDVFCRVVPHVDRSEWERKFASGLICDWQKTPVSASHRVRAGERYFHVFRGVTEPDVNGDIQILHEDRALIVVNKPAPLPMHAGGRFNRNALQFILNQVYHPEKPRPAHRLDANTTGVLLLTRTRHYASLLQPQFAAGTVRKIYIAKIQGHPEKDEFACDAAISAAPREVGTRDIDEEDGLPSLTEFRILRRQSDGTALVEARPLTGRTNQIRVHLWHLGFPICGDAVYLADRKFGVKQTLALDDPPLCLHSHGIQFKHPLTGEMVEFTAPVPEWGRLE